MLKLVFLTLPLCGIETLLLPHKNRLPVLSYLNWCKELSNAETYIEEFSIVLAKDPHSRRDAIMTKEMDLHDVLTLVLVVTVGVAISVAIVAISAAPFLNETLLTALVHVENRVAAADSNRAVARRMAVATLCRNLHLKCNS